MAQAHVAALVAGVEFAEQALGSFGPVSVGEQCSTVAVFLFSEVFFNII